MFRQLEKKYENKVIVLVSHADTLQIAHMLLSNNDPRKFSQYRFQNGEVRNLLSLQLQPKRMMYQ